MGLVLLHKHLKFQWLFLSVGIHRHKITNSIIYIVSNWKDSCSRYVFIYPHIRRLILTEWFNLINIVVYVYVCRRKGCYVCIFLFLSSYLTDNPLRMPNAYLYEFSIAAIINYHKFTHITNLLFYSFINQKFNMGLIWLKSR